MKEISDNKKNINIEQIEKLSNKDSIKLFINNLDIFSDNLNLSYGFLRKMEETKISTTDQVDLGTNIGLIFENNYNDNKKTGYYSSNISVLSKIIGKKENNILFENIQNSVDNSYNGYWNNLIGEAILPQSTANKIDFSKVNGYNFKLSNHNISNETKIGFVKHCIKENEIGNLDSQYLDINKLIDSKTRKNLIDKIEKSFIKGIVHETIIISELESFSVELREKFIYNFSLKTKELSTFYDYEKKSPPMVGDYDFDDEIVNIDFDDELSPSDEDVIDHYENCLEYKYLKDEDVFIEKDEDGEILNEVSMSDGTDNLINSRNESFEFDLESRYNLKNYDIFKEDFSGCGNSVDIYIEKLNGIDCNKDYDEFISDFVIDIRSGDYLIHIGGDEQVDLFNHILEHIFPNTKYGTDFSAVNYMNIKKGLYSYFDLLDYDSKIQIITDIYEGSNSEELSIIEEGLTNTQLLSFISEKNFINDLSEQIIEFIDLTSYEYVVDEDDYYDIKQIKENCSTPGISLNNLIDTPKDFNYSTELNNVSKILNVFAQNKFHYEAFGNFIPAFSEKMITKDDIIENLKQGNSYIFFSNIGTKYIEEIDAKTIYDIYFNLRCESLRTTFVNNIVKNTSDKFKVRLFDEVVPLLGKNGPGFGSEIIRSVFSAVIDSTNRNPLIEITKEILKNKESGFYPANTYFIYEVGSSRCDKVYREFINKYKDKGFYDNRFLKNNYNLSRFLCAEQNVDVLKELYSKFNDNGVNSISHIYINRNKSTIEDMKFFIDNYKGTIKLDKVLLEVIAELGKGSKDEVIDYILENTSIYKKIIKGETIYDYMQLKSLSKVSHRLSIKNIQLLLKSNSLDNTDKHRIFENLISENYKDDDNRIHTYDFNKLGKETIYALFNSYQLRFILNDNSSPSGIFRDIFVGQKDKHLINNTLVGYLKEYLKDNFGFIGNIDANTQIKPNGIDNDYFSNALKNNQDFLMGIDTHIIETFSYENYIVCLGKDYWDNNTTLKNPILNAIVSSKMSEIANIDRKNGYIILKHIILSGYKLEELKKNHLNVITEDLLNEINKYFEILGVKLTKDKIFSLQNLLTANKTSELFLPKLSSKNNKDIINGLTKLGVKDITSPFFETLNSEDSLYLLNNKIFGYYDLGQTHRVISRLNDIDFNSFFYDFIFEKKNIFDGYIYKFADELDLSRLNDTFFDTLIVRLKKSDSLLSIDFIDCLSRVKKIDKSIISNLIDYTNIEHKKLVKIMFNKHNAKLSDILRIMNTRAIEQLEKSIPFTIEDMINNSKNYNLIPQVAQINQKNNKEFKKNGLDINLFNSFNKKISFSSGDGINIKDIYSNLESSLVNQYSFLFGSDKSHGVLDGMNKNDSKGISKDVLDMYNTTLKEIGKGIKNIHKGVGVDISNEGLYFKDIKSFKELGKNANLLVNSLGNSTKIIDKAFLFKDEFINSLDKAKKIIFNKVKKKVSVNIEKLYNDKTIDNDRVDKINENLFKVNTKDISILVEKIKNNSYKKSNDIINQNIDSINSDEIKIYFKNIELKNINTEELKHINGFMKLINKNEKKGLGIIINEIKKVSELNNLERNCSDSHLNNFKKIFNKISTDDNYANGDNIKHFMDIGLLLNNDNSNLSDFMFEIEQLYSINKENKSVKELYDYMTSIEKVLGHYKKIKENVYSHLKDDFGNIDTDKIKKIINEKREYSMKIWDRHNIIENLNQGHYTHCCISPTGFNGWSMPKYIVSDNFNIVEIRSNDKIIGQAFCYVGKKNNKMNLVIDNVEINNSYVIDSEIIKSNIISYVKDFRDHIGNLDEMIKIGNSYNDVKVNGSNCNVSTIIGFKGLYLDSTETQREFI